MAAVKENPMVERLRNAAVKMGAHNDFQMHDLFLKAAAEIERQHALLNTAEFHDFAKGVVLEAAHQVQRWGEAHDRAKTPADWFWLLGYLAGKALAAANRDDKEKALHHCISSAGVLANWHAHISGNPTGFTPGASDLQRDVEAVFGSLDDESLPLAPLRNEDGICVHCNREECPGDCYTEELGRDPGFDEGEHIDPRCPECGETRCQHGARIGPTVFHFFTCIHCGRPTPSKYHPSCGKCIDGK